MTLQSIGLAILRIGLGVMMMVHGWAKLSNYSGMRTQFADPFGLGMDISLMLAIFAEFFCSIFLILGIGTRLAVIPLIVTMLVAIFHAHGADPWGKKELAAMYLLGYVTLLVAGSGMFSLDGVVASWWRKRRSRNAMRDAVKAEMGREAAKTIPKSAPPKA